MAAPPTPQITCALAPPPNTWSSVAPENYGRLNAIIQAWNEHIHLLDMAELCVDDEDRYVWQIVPLADHRVTAEHLELIRQLPFVIDVECDMSIRTKKIRSGAVCVSVRTARTDARPHNAAAAAAVPPIHGTTYVSSLRETCGPQLAEMLQAARAMRQ